MSRSSSMSRIRFIRLRPKFYWMMPDGNKRTILHGVGEGYVTGWLKESRFVRLRLRRWSSNLQENSAAVERPQQGENYSGKKDCEGERRIHRAGVRDEESAVEPALKRSLVAVEAQEFEIGAEFGDKFGEGVREDRVHSEDQERRRPRARGTHIDEPIAGGQGEHGEAAR